MGRSVEDTLKDLQAELLRKPKNFKKNKVKGDQDRPQVHEEGKSGKGNGAAVMGDISNTKRALGLQDSEKGSEAQRAEKLVQDLYTPSNLATAERMQIMHPYRENGFFPGLAPEFYPGPQWRWTREASKYQNDHSRRIAGGQAQVDQV